MRKILDIIAIVFSSILALLFFLILIPSFIICYQNNDMPTLLLISMLDVFLFSLSELMVVMIHSFALKILEA